jgi:hypothetical protein
MVLRGFVKKARATTNDAQNKDMAEIDVLVASGQPASAPILRALERDRSSKKCLNLLQWFSKNNMVNDDDGLATYIRVLDATVKVTPGMRTFAPRMAFPGLFSEELEACRRALSVLEEMADSLQESGGTHPPIAGLRAHPHLPATVVQDEVAPADAMERWGFVVVGAYTASHKAIAARLKESLERFGIPFSLWEVPEIHMTKSCRGGSDLGYTQPNLTLMALERFNVPVVWMDCDLVVKEEPVELRALAQSGVDLACVNPERVFDRFASNVSVNCLECMLG